MTIVCVSEPPRTPWWGIGIPAYSDNWAMAEGCVPDGHAFIQEYQAFIDVLRGYGQILTIPFPEELDKRERPCHDFVFVRDSFVSDCHGTVLLSRFRRHERQPESEYMAQFFRDLGFKIRELTDGFLEGGDLVFLRRERILFAGTVRSDKHGVEAAARLLRVKDLFFVKTRAYHLDTVFNIVFDEDGRACGALACTELIANACELCAFLSARRIPLLKVLMNDGIGKPGASGSMAINALSLPGVLLGCARLTTPGAEEVLERWGIRHTLVRAVECRLSGGGVHCLTNEL